MRLSLLPLMTLVTLSRVVPSLGWIRGRATMVQRGRAPARLAAVSQTPEADRRLVIVESPAKVTPLSRMGLSSLHP